MSTWTTREVLADTVEERLDSNGAANIDVTQEAPAGRRYRIQHIGLQIDAQTGTDDPAPTAKVYIGKSARKENFRDGTGSASTIAAHYTHPLIVTSGERLIIGITDGLPAGDAIIHVQYALEERAE